MPQDPVDPRKANCLRGGEQPPYKQLQGGPRKRGPIGGSTWADPGSRPGSPFYWEVKIGRGFWGASRLATRHDLASTCRSLRGGTMQHSNVTHDFFLSFIRRAIHKAVWLAERSRIETVCMCCKKHLRGPKNGKVVSHGLCTKCFHIIAGEHEGIKH